MHQSSSIQRQSAGHQFGRLSSQIRRLGATLGKVIARLEGESILQLVETCRKLAKASRSGSRNAGEKLRGIIAALDAKTAYETAMAFTLYFELVNLAEERYRISILRKRRAEHIRSIRSGGEPAPVRESIEGAIIRLKERGVTADQMRGLLRSLRIELVFTAHPTESKRRTILTKLRRLADLLERQDLPLAQAFPIHDNSAVEREIVSLWLTDRSRSVRPEVIDEVRNGLWYFETNLWDIIPHLQDDLEQALARHYPGVKAPAGWLSFGSWIGGDRDGNPFVTSGVSTETLLLHRKLALDKHREAIRHVSRLLSVSSQRDAVAEQFRKILESDPVLSGRLPGLSRRYPNEPYRLLLDTLQSRLEEERSRDSRLQLESDAPSDALALCLDEVDNVLRSVEKSIASGRAGVLADGELRQVRCQYETYGLHTARLDYRLHSGQHEDALHEIFAGFGIESSYKELPESSKVRLLNRLLEETSPRNPLDRVESFDESVRNVIDPLFVARRARERFGSRSMGTYIVSMTHRLSDILEPLVLMRWCEVVLPIAPLFETHSDLRRAPAVLRSLFRNRPYRKHLDATGEPQHVMLGYSDSNKDCGYIAANWALYRAQEEIAAVCTKARIPLSVFHGRGGSIARGGGPAAKAILSQPCCLRDGAIRVTEQGEVLSTRYHDPDLAHRILEQMTYGVLLGTWDARKESPVPDEWTEAMDVMADTGHRVYRRLVRKTPGFLDFWRHATPIDEISQLKLGSRPAFRKETRTVDDLRAIPWVFSWMQSRFDLPGWFGLGSALETILLQGTTGRRLLSRMYGKWSFFQTLIDNAQLAMNKADMKIASRQAELVPDPKVRKAVLDAILDEYSRTEKAVLRVTRQESLLSRQPVLKRSIALRNPYVDPLNYIQAEMIRRLRKGINDAAEHERTRAVLQLTIKGISAGLKNTG